MIRHTLASLAIGLVLLGAAPASAQAPTLTPSHLQLAREVMDLTGVTQNVNNIYLEFQDSAKQLVSTRPEATKDMEAVINELKPEADKRTDEMLRTSAAVFASKMTEADLKEITAFFKSPVGQRYTSLRAEAMKDIIPLLQPWSVQTSNYLFDRFSQEMRKRGHTL